MMLYALLIVNLVTTWLFIGLLVRHVYGDRLEFNWRTTFFGEVRHGFQVTLWDRPRRFAPNSGRVIFDFDWRQRETIEDRPYIKPASVWARPLLFQRSGAGRGDTNEAQASGRTST